MGHYRGREIINLVAVLISKLVALFWVAAVKPLGLTMMIIVARSVCIIRPHFIYNIMADEATDLTCMAKT